jgi:hypothetical protein
MRFDLVLLVRPSIGEALALGASGGTVYVERGRYGAGELAGLSFSTTSVAMNFNGAAPSFMPT